MKKLLFCLMAAGTITACKKETNEKEVTEVQSDSTEVVSAKAIAPTVDCSSDSIIQAYNNQPDADKPEWLRVNGHLICENNLYECIEQRHGMPKDSLDKLIKAHPENAAKPVYYTKKWSEIKSFISGVNCYEKYLGFSFSGGTMSLKLMNTYSSTETSYSIPFIRSAGAGLSNNTVFRFSKAMIPRTVGGVTVVEERVVFCTMGALATECFDITRDPILPK